MIINNDKLIIGCIFFIAFDHGGKYKNCLSDPLSPGKKNFTTGFGVLARPMLILQSLKACGRPPKANFYTPGREPNLWRARGL